MIINIVVVVILANFFFFHNVKIIGNESFDTTLSRETLCYNLFQKILFGCTYFLFRFKDGLDDLDNFFHSCIRGLSVHHAVEHKPHLHVNKLIYF